MPQEEKFITRAKGNINYMDSDYTQTKKGMKANTGAYKKQTGPAYDRYMKLSAEARKDRAGSDPLALGRARKALDDANNTAFPKQYDAEIKATNRVVTARDAANARTARGRLTERASEAKAQPRGSGMMAKAAALGPVAEGAAAMFAADEATDFKRTKYSGNFGGPSFSKNPYSSTASYPGQSKMSMMMGVGKKK